MLGGVVERVLGAKPLTHLCVKLFQTKFAESQQR